MNISANNVVWRETGFRLEATAKNGNLVCQFEGLNPQVELRQVFSRWEMVRLGLWFIRSAFKKEQD